MATYIPNATQTTEPVESRTVESAALEFRTLKTSINARIEDVQDGLDAEIVNRIAADSAETAARIAGDAALQTTNNAQDVRLQAIEAALLAIGEGGLPGTVYVQRLSGTGAQTAFTLNVSVPTSALIDVFSNGVYQNKDTFTISGTSLTFSEAPPAGTNNIEVVVSITIANVETDASLVSFRATDSTTVVRTVQDKMREVVSVKDFGAVGDGIADDTAAIQAAIDHVATLNGGTVFFPSGEYLVSATFNISTSKVKLVGDGMYNTVVKRNSDYGSTFVFSGNDVTGAVISGCEISELTIRSAGLVTSGAHIVCNGAFKLNISRIFLDQGFIGFLFKGLTASYVSDVYVTFTNLYGGTVAGRKYMVFDSAASTYAHPSSGDVFVNNFNLRGNTANQITDYGIQIISADGLWFENGHVGNCTSANIHIAKTTTEMLNLLFFSNVMSDEGLNNGVLITGNAAGGFQKLQFSNCTFKSGGTPAFAKTGINIAAFCTVKEVQFSNCAVTEYGESGVQIASANAKNLEFNNCQVAFNGRNASGTYPGYNLLAGVNSLRIIGGMSGSNTSQSYGIQLGGSHAYVTVIGTDFTGNGLGPINGYHPEVVFAECRLDNPSVVASASTLPVLSGHRAVLVTGTTTINNIQVAQPGNMLMLKFQDPVTVKDGTGNISLNGDFNATANDTLTLVYLGSTWNEIARSVN